MSSQREKVEGRSRLVYPSPGVKREGFEREFLTDERLDEIFDEAVPRRTVIVKDPRTGEGRPYSLLAPKGQVSALAYHLSHDKSLRLTNLTAWGILAEELEFTIFLGTSELCLDDDQAAEIAVVSQALEMLHTRTAHAAKEGFTTRALTEIVKEEYHETVSPERGGFYGYFGRGMRGERQRR